MLTTFSSLIPGLVAWAILSSPFFTRIRFWPFQRNHVRQSAQRHQIENLFHIETWPLQRIRKKIIQFGHEKEGDPHAGQRFAWAVSELGIASTGASGDHPEEDDGRK